MITKEYHQDFNLLHTIIFGENWFTFSVFSPRNAVFVINSVHLITCQNHIVRSRNNPQNFVSHLGIHEFNDNPTRKIRPVHFKVLKHTKERVEKIPLLIFHQKTMSFQDLKQGYKLYCLLL